MCIIFIENVLNLIIKPNIYIVVIELSILLLHVHPLLGNVLVNDFPQRQILDKQSVARLRSSRGGRVFYVVRAKQQYNKGVMQSVSKQWKSKHVYNNRCFPWCLCRVLIREVYSDATSVQFRAVTSRS
jgi:hypothetical protein